MKITKGIFIISVVIQIFIWIIFSIINFINASTHMIVIILMAANGVCFLLTAFLFDKRMSFRTIIYVFLAVNLILTFTDETGFFDYVVLVLNIVSIISLTTYSILKKKQNI